MTARLTTPTGLTVQGLEVVYSNAVQALAGVSLSVPRGSFVSVLGSNGAGKTTLVRAVMGTLFVHDGRIREGHVEWDGVELSGLSSSAIVRQGISHVPEGRMLFPNLTVEENLRVGAATRKDRAFVDKDLGRMWDIFPLIATRKKQRAGLLSGGEQQMVAIARGLMGRPKLLICDELSLGLAPMIVKDLFELLAELNKNEGTSILAIEQNARLALDYARYGYVLETGSVAIEGSNTELVSNPFVQEFYLGGAGDVKAAYQEVARRFAGEGRRE
jgi:branched-chain amino acid transport system ATP-binding protein